VPTFEDRGCRVVSVTDPYGRILGFLDREWMSIIKKMVKQKHKINFMMMNNGPADQKVENLPNNKNLNRCRETYY
jgi:hypothetical protein